MMNAGLAGALHTGLGWFCSAEPGRGR